MKIKSRYFLLALLIASQTACLGFGVVWATGWLWNAFRNEVYNHVVAEGRALAHELALKTAEMGLENIEPGSADWKRLQSLCEQAVIPHDGFALVMRRDNGAMVCHPNIEKDPGLLRLFPGRYPLISEHSTAPVITLIRESEDQGVRVVTGRVEFDGQLHIISAYSLPQLNAVLAVYQSDRAIDLFIASTIRPVMQIGYILTAFTVGATAIITLFLINRYEIGLTEANARLEDEVCERTQSLVRTRNAVIFGLARLSESRNRDTSKHLERIRSYVTILSSEMAKKHPEIDHHYVADLAIASSLHDIGKIGIPDAVLMKPGPLTSGERRAMQLHTVLGSECLAAIQRQLGEDDFLELTQQIAVAHHEHWDGNGYPYGVQGKKIPLAARIVALADVYDAMTSDRPYKQPVEHAEAYQWIVDQYATQFDPKVVEAFIVREKDFARINNRCAEATQVDHDASLESILQPNNADGQVLSLS